MQRKSVTVLRILAVKMNSAPSRQLWWYAGFESQYAFNGLRQCQFRNSGKFRNEASPALKKKDQDKPYKTGGDKEYGSCKYYIVKIEGELSSVSKETSAEAQ